MLFVFYPTIVTILAESQNCMEIEDDLRLLQELSEVCYEGKHLLLTLTVTLPGIICWAFGIPFMAYRQLKENVSRLDNIQKHINGQPARD